MDITKTGIAELATLFPVFGMEKSQSDFFIIWYVLATIAGFFFVWLAVKPAIDKKFNVKFCAVCAAVVSTWIILLAANVLGFIQSQLLLAILMGQSIAGAMYLMERREGLKGFKILAVIIGTAVVYYLLRWIG